MFNKITLGPITVYMYGLMIAIGFASALFLCNYRGKKRGLSEDTIFGIFLCALIGGMVGCRLLYYIVELPAIMEDPSILWDFKNGYVVYGGIIGGIVTSYVYCRIKKENFISYFDLVMPAVSMAQGFGRIGCFCAGCCYGRETHAWYGITFTHSDFAPNGVSLIPTQLISSAGGYLVLYGVGRFLIEFLRNDYRGSLGIFSTSQIISFGIVALGIALYFVIPKMMEKKE